MPISKLDSNKEHFQEALNHHDSILIILDRFQLELPYDDHERFPENWMDDPLLLLGQYLEILDLGDMEAEKFRLITYEFVEANGPEWFWGNRMRLAAEIAFVRRF
ncbi:MAG: hypothetical protein HY787_09005 [Deltaproteobacteria bacterium]|nr:hypothetical protein [Deltaproteobacteria bacterium]